MRKYGFIILSALILLCVFSSCGKGDSGQSSGTSSSSVSTYTVRFVIDEEIVEEQNVKAGEQFSKPSCDTAKEGYTFDGWMTESGTKVNWNSPFGREVDSDMTITAHYTIKTYTVRFYVNDNEIGKAQKVEYGKQFVLPSDEDVDTSEYLEVIGYRLNGLEEIYTADTLDKTVKGNTRVDVILGLKTVGEVVLSGLKKDFLYLEKFEKGANAEVKIIFADGGEYVLSENEYETVVPEDFGKQVKDYNIGIKIAFEECDDMSYTATVKANRERFSVLIIGNSYSDDTIAYAYRVAKSAGIKDVEVADLYYGGCTIDQHVNFAANNSSEYIFRYFDKDNLTHNVDSLNYEKVTMEYGITYKPWDIIVLQQGSGVSGISGAYSKLPQLINYVKAHATNENVRFAFNMTWAYAKNSSNGSFGNYGKDQLKMYNAILSAVQKEVLTNKDFIAVIPNGTAVQNARTSFIGDNLTRDNYDHLTRDTGRYIAAMTFITELTGLSVDEISYKPDGLTGAYMNVAKESVKNALNKPFEVTLSQFTDESEALIGNRAQTLVTFTQGWYDSTLADGYKLQTGSNYLNKFKATQKFTRETLPIGSLIYIASGWQYRPEGWKNTEKVSPRQGNVTTQWIEITEEWWGEYTERAFNISTMSSSDISGKEQADMESVFKIYVHNK